VQSLALEGIYTTLHPMDIHNILNTVETAVESALGVEINAVEAISKMASEKFGVAEDTMNDLMARAKEVLADGDVDMADVQQQLMGLVAEKGVSTENAPSLVDMVMGALKK
jgi:urease gamma subunit